MGLVMSFVMNDVCVNMLNTVLWPTPQEHHPCCWGSDPDTGSLAAKVGLQADDHTCDSTTKWLLHVGRSPKRLWPGSLESARLRADSGTVPSLLKRCGSDSVCVTASCVGLPRRKAQQGMARCVADKHHAWCLHDFATHNVRFASVCDNVFLRLNQAADPNLWKMTEELLARDPESAKRCAEDRMFVTA